MRGVGEDAVAVLLGDDVADHVEVIVDGLGPEDVDVVGEPAGDGAGEAVGGDRRVGVELGALAEGVDARVGAGRAQDVDLARRGADDLADGALDLGLNGAELGAVGLGLALPAVEGGAVVGEGEFEALHRRGGKVIGSRTGALGLWFSWG
ncbi:MAG: hypothetical protein AAGE65_00015 [Planctomycetota bacterium]